MNFVRLVELETEDDKSKPLPPQCCEISDTRYLKRKRDADQNDDLSRFKRVRIISLEVIKKQQGDQNQGEEVVPGDDISSMLNCNKIWYVHSFPTFDYLADIVLGTNYRIVPTSRTVLLILISYVRNFVPTPAARKAEWSLTVRLSMLFSSLSMEPSASTPTPQLKTRLRRDD